MAQGLLKVFQTVRLRIPSKPATKGTLDSLIEDRDREVRITVADRLPPERLERLVADPDYDLSTNNMFQEPWIPKIKSGSYTHFQLFDLRKENEHDHH